MNPTMDIGRYEALDLEHRLEVDAYLEAAGRPPAHWWAWDIQANREGAIVICRYLRSHRHALANPGCGLHLLYLEAEHCGLCEPADHGPGGAGSRCEHWSLLYVREVLRVDTPPPWLAWP